MKYHIYKFHFSTALHIGNGNLTDGESMVCADTFFSGLCHEAVKYGGQACIDSLVQDAKSGKLLFSDMLPFISDELYIPKPLNPVKTEQEGDSVQKKKFKKLKFKKEQKIDAYLAGNLDPEDEISKFKSLGSFDMRTMSSSLDPEKSLTGDMLPFSVGTYKFGANNGLYIIAAFADSETEKTIDAMEDVNAYIEIIKENIEYDHYMKYSDWQDRELYDELFEIICEVVCVKHKTVRIGGDDYPYELVKAKFLKLNSSHLNYVIGCMKNTTTKITNIKAYMVTTLYNAPSTINHYYQQEVQHDMYGGGWHEKGIV